MTCSCQLFYPNRCVTLDPAKGERAMLVKDTAGDWAIVKGFWTGMKKGIPGVAGGDYCRAS